MRRAAVLSTRPPGGTPTWPQVSSTQAPPLTGLGLHIVGGDKAVSRSTNHKARDLGSSSQPDPDHLRGSSSPSLSSLTHKMMLIVESTRKGHGED